MSDTQMVNQLDEAIDTLLAGSCTARSSPDPELARLMTVAAELRTMPASAFRDRLKVDLLQLEGPSARRASRPATRKLEGPTRVQSGQAPGILPTLTGLPGGLYPVRRSSFVASVFAHFAILTLLITSGIWAAHNTPESPRVISQIVTDITYPLPPASTTTKGGGGGGDHDSLTASKGVPPRFSDRQVVPPAIVVRAEQPRLQREPTVIGPPNLLFPQTGQLGDPLSNATIPSNGIGSDSGIGSGRHSGVGSGDGPGVGPGLGGGMGDGPYVVGRGVRAPRAVYDPEPDYSEEARKQKFQGTVVLQIVVGPDGQPSHVKVVRSVGLGLDEKAIEAVSQWRFEPGTKDGRPVAVVVNIQVNFRLY